MDDRDRVPPGLALGAAAALAAGWAGRPDLMIWAVLAGTAASLLSLLRSRP